MRHREPTEVTDTDGAVPVPVALFVAFTTEDCAQLFHDDAVAQTLSPPVFGIDRVFAPVAGATKYQVDTEFPDAFTLVVPACVSATPLYVGAPPALAVAERISMFSTSNASVEALLVNEKLTGLAVDSRLCTLSENVIAISGNLDIHRELDLIV